MARTLKQRLGDALGELDHVLEGEGVFDGTERGFFVDGQLVAEFAGSNYIGVRLTRAIIRDLKPQLIDPRVDPIRPGSDWIYLRFRRAGDLTFIVELVAIATAAYVPQETRPLRPPPTGNDLARRRRLH